MGDWPIKLRLTQNLFDKGLFFSRCGIETARNVCPGKVQELKCATLSTNTVAEHVSDIYGYLRYQLTSRSNIFKPIP